MAITNLILKLEMQEISIMSRMRILSIVLTTLSKATETFQTKVVHTVLVLQIRKTYFFNRSR